MLYVIKAAFTALFSIIIQLSSINMVSTTPEEAASDFLEGLKAREPRVMEKYMDNSYVNFICNVQGNEAVIERMNSAIFDNFSYDIEKVAEKDNVAVAKVTVKSGDFSGVLDAYDKESYDYVMKNLYTDDIADKDKLDAKCLEIYVSRIEKAAESGKTKESVVFVPMTDDGHYGWNIIMTNELMRSVLGDLDIPGDARAK